MKTKITKKSILMQRTAILLIAFSLSLTACVKKGSNPVDPYEPINREIHKFNMAFDATALKPPAKLYKVILPPQVRAGIDNVYNNINMLPTVANDILQADWNSTVKDTWRFLINSTFGIAGIFDVADSRFSLPPRSNDLGLTFAKWGDKKSPYIVVPFFGPSTIRDWVGITFDYALFTPYPYIRPVQVTYGVLALRYIDLRAQMLTNDQLIGEAFDSYTFIRDAYLQRRQFLMTGQQDTLGSLYVDENSDDDAEEPEGATRSEFPITTAKNHAPRRPLPA